MQLNLFNGGLNLRGSPFLISQNQSVECENIDFAKGSLTPRYKNLVLDKGIKPYIYKFKGNWIQSDNPRDYVEYQDKLYYTEASKKPQKSTDGINFYNLGIDKPNKDLTIQVGLTDAPIELKPFYSVFPDLKAQENPLSYQLYLEYSLTVSGARPGYTFVMPDEKQFFNKQTYLQSVYGTSETSFNDKYFGFSKLDSSTYNLYKNYVQFISSGSLSPVYRAEKSVVIQLDKSKSYVNSSVPALFYENVRDEFGDPYAQSRAILFTQATITDDRKTTKASLNITQSIAANNPYPPSFKSTTIQKTEENPYSYNNLNKLFTFFESSSEVTIFIKNKTSNEILRYNIVVSESLVSDKVLMGYTIESKSEDFNLDDYEFFVFNEFDSDSNPFKLVKDPSGLPAGLHWLNFEFDETVKYSSLGNFYTFCYTYYNINDGTESSPSDYQDIDVGQLNTIIWDTEVEDKQVTHVRLYCIGKNNTNMTLLAEVPLNYGSYTFPLDAIQNMTGEVLASQLYYAAPENLQYLTESNGILYGAKGYTLYFSNDGNANYWNPFNTIEYETEIKGIARVYQGLLVFLIDKTYLVTGSSIDDIVNYRLSSTVGCLDHRSIQYSNSNVIWASSAGICSCKGGTISNLSMANLGTFNITETIRFSAYHNDIYYLALPGRVFLMDLRFEVLFEYLNEDIVSYFRDPLTNILYAVDFYNNFVQVQGSQELSKVKYLSPKYSDGSISTLKSYKNIYLYVEGSLSLTIYLDGKNVLEVDLSEGFNDIKIPQPDTQGYYLQFKVEGYGIMHELSYTFEGRQNGR